MSTNYCNANSSVYFDIKLGGKGNRLTGKMNNSEANIRKYIPLICDLYVVSIVPRCHDTTCYVRLYDNNAMLEPTGGKISSGWNLAGSSREISGLFLSPRLQ